MGGDSPLPAVAGPGSSFLDTAVVGNTVGPRKRDQGLGGLGCQWTSYVAKAGAGWQQYATEVNL